MNCYRSLRPSEHLKFNPNGTVEPRSRYGHETIRTVGLNREPLRDEREAVTRDAYEQLRRLAVGDKAQQDTAVRDLHRIGDEGRAFAGVARTIVEQNLEMSWEEFLCTFATT